MSRLAALPRAPWAVAALVLLIYELYLGFAIPYSHDTKDFIQIGDWYVRWLQAHTPGAIDAYLRAITHGGGYDGQYAYYIARDPLHAHTFIDYPAYRYTRILQPMLARLLALGQPGAIPYALVFINWIAIAGGTLALAYWLRAKQYSPWYALVYGLYPGLFVCLRYDLTEPLSFALLGLGAYLYDCAGRRRLVGSAAAFSLALLTRESTIVFPLCYGLALLWEGGGLPWRRMFQQHWPSSVLFLLVSCGPLLLFKGLLLLWLGSLGVPHDVQPVHVPFGGLMAWYPWQAQQQEELRSVVFPALICGAMCSWALWHRVFQPQVLALGANIVLFVIFLAPASYNDFYNSGRISTGVVLAAILCLPCFAQAGGNNRWWFWSSSALWLSLAPFWLVVPIVDSWHLTIVHHFSHG